VGKLSLGTVLRGDDICGAYPEVKATKDHME